MSDKVYPISEIFTSPQGEGLYAGTLMTFIRLAGCSVGKPFPKERYGLASQVSEGNAALPTLLPIYTEQCTTYDGRTFECDTDYRVKERLDVTQILGRVYPGVRHICITGGEPFIHSLIELVIAAARSGLHTSIETSGTVQIDLSSWLHDARAYMEGALPYWLTVSPKLGARPDVIKVADEIKLLVDEHFNVDRLPLGIREHKLVWIQPINYEHAINQDNLQRCLQLQQQFPHWRISTQLHKIWGVR